MDNYYNTDALASVVGTGFATAYFVIVLAISVLIIIGNWKMYKKAGKPGWACIIPFYAQYCLFDIAWGSGWLFLLTFIPCVNFVVMIILCFKLAKAFGQGVGFGFGLLFLPGIFLLILGFGKAEYVGAVQ